LTCIYGKSSWQFTECSVTVVGLFGKAKRKLLGKEMESGLTDVTSRPAGLLTATDASSAAVGGIDPALWEPQELGKKLRV